MRKKNYKGAKVSKRVVAKCEGVCRTYDAIQYVYANLLSETEEVKSFQVNVLLQGLQKVVDGEGYAMHIMLIDTFTGKLVKQKIYGMPHDTSKHLYKMVMEQRKKFLNKEEYEENIRDIYGVYSTKKLLKFAN
ncbi:MAG: hypothetical protein V8S90_02250 [Lachnospiraceae bacterium]